MANVNKVAVLLIKNSRSPQLQLQVWVAFNEGFAVFRGTDRYKYIYTKGTNESVGEFRVLNGYNWIELPTPKAGGPAGCFRDIFDQAVYNPADPDRAVFQPNARRVAHGLPKSRFKQDPTGIASDVVVARLLAMTLLSAAVQARIAFG
jgi:hypothetical protein